MIAPVEYDSRPKVDDGAIGEFRRKVHELDERWVSVCAEQGWSDESKLVHLERFLRERGLLGEFVAYAEAAAIEENEMTEHCDGTEPSVPRA